MYSTATSLVDLEVEELTHLEGDDAGCGCVQHEVHGAGEAGAGQDGALCDVDFLNLDNIAGGDLGKACFSHGTQWDGCRIVFRPFILLFCNIFIHRILVFIIVRVLLNSDSSGNLCLSNSLYFLRIQLKAGDDRMGVSDTWFGKEAQFAWRFRFSRRGCLARGWWCRWSSGLGIRGGRT